ncbi:MAG: hypothetical protein ACXVFT_12530 [Solirubrobacteraceae bacterium]
MTTTSRADLHVHSTASRERAMGQLATGYRRALGAAPAEARRAA